MIRRRDCWCQRPSAVATATKVAVIVLLFCVGPIDGYAFSTKGATNPPNNGGVVGANGSGPAPSFAPPVPGTTATTLVPAADATTTTTTSSSGSMNSNSWNPLNVKDKDKDKPTAQPPVFSGFGHVTSTTTTDTPKATTTAPPTFSGFGHAHGVSPVFPTTLPVSSSSSTSTAAASPPPIFSGFGHALGRTTSNGIGGIGSGTTTTTATTTIPWGVVGSSLYDANNKNDHDDDEDDDNDDTATSVMDPDLYEASQFLHEARNKVLQLRQELELKANQQKDLVQQLRSELKSQEIGYEARLERLAEQFQEYKFAVHRQKLELQDQLKIREDAIRAEAAIREQLLQSELASVQTELVSVKEELLLCQQWNETMTEQFASLQANFTELRQMYMEEQLEWEDRLEMEQNDRRKDRWLAETMLKQAQEEATDKIRRARMDGTVVVEAVKSDLNNKLWQKETLLQKTSLELKRTVLDKNGLEVRLEELEAEREDLGALTKQTAKVVKEVAKNKATDTIQKAKNFFRRNKLG